LKKKTREKLVKADLLLFEVGNNFCLTAGTYFVFEKTFSSFALGSRGNITAKLHLNHFFLN